MILIEKKEKRPHGCWRAMRKANGRSCIVNKIVLLGGGYFMSRIRALIKRWLVDLIVKDLRARGSIAGEIQALIEDSLWTRRL